MKTDVTEDIARQSLDIIPRLNRWAQSAMLQERIVELLVSHGQEYADVSPFIFGNEVAPLRDAHLDIP